MTTFKGNNRAILTINNEQHYILHNTAIVIQKENKIILNTAGYFTYTTKKAMNEVGNMLGFKVYQKDNKFYVEYNNKTIEYYDNMELELNLNHV